MPLLTSVVATILSLALAAAAAARLARTRRPARVLAPRRNSKPIGQH